MLANEYTKTPILIPGRLPIRLPGVPSRSALLPETIAADEYQFNINKKILSNTKELLREF